MGVTSQIDQSIIAPEVLADTVGEIQYLGHSARFVMCSTYLVQRTVPVLRPVINLVMPISAVPDAVRVSADFAREKCSQCQMRLVK